MGSFKKEALDALGLYRRSTSHILGESNERVGIIDTCIALLDEIEEKTQWIPVIERRPKCEQEVLICTKKKLVGRDVYIDSIITPAIYEDGTMLENDSSWHWEDIDWAGWDDEEDCGIIPEGWWENRHFNPDDVYNNLVDQEVVAWMPLPEPYKGDDAV